MNRPKWWEFNTTGEFLQAQYNYIKSIKKVNIKDFIIPIGAKNRSTIYNIFRGSLSINPDKMDTFRFVFKLTEVEAEYLSILSSRDRATYQYEKTVWQQLADDFIKENKPKNMHSRKTESINFEWDDFFKAEEQPEVRKKKRVKIPLQ